MVLLIFVRARSLFAAVNSNLPLTYLTGICICTDLEQRVFPPCIQCVKQLSFWCLRLYWNANTARISFSRHVCGCYRALSELQIIRLTGWDFTTGPVNYPHPQSTTSPIPSYCTPLPPAYLASPYYLASVALNTIVQELSSWRLALPWLHLSHC